MHSLCSGLRPLATCALALIVLAAPSLHAQAPSGSVLDLSQAVIEHAPGASARERAALALLVDEVEARTRIRCRLSSARPPGSP
jgi:hypothetical protein